MEKRELSIDIFKGILTLLMICAHIVQFFPMNFITSYFSVYVNLTTFSGFMFAFGYVCFKSYIINNVKRDVLRKKLTNNFLKTIVAFYISAIGNTVIVNKDISAKSLFNILIFNKIPGYSEFILSFAFIYIFVYVFRDIFNKMPTIAYIFIIVISYLSTFINYSLVQLRVLGVIFGSTRFACFPILQYFSLFMLGGYLCKTKQVFNWKILCGSLVGTASFIMYFIIRGEYPKRFPPSLIWIVGSYFFIYAYYIICKKVESKKFPDILSFMGRNSLCYLVISNLIIFTVDRAINMKLGKKKLLLLYVTLFILCQSCSIFYVSVVKEKFMKRNRDDVKSLNVP